MVHIYHFWKCDASPYNAIVTFVRIFSASYVNTQPLFLVWLLFVPVTWIFSNATNGRRTRGEVAAIGKQKDLSVLNLSPVHFSGELRAVEFERIFSCISFKPSSFYNIHNLLQSMNTFWLIKLKLFFSFSWFSPQSLVHYKYNRYRQRTRQVALTYEVPSAFIGAQYLTERYPYMWSLVNPQILKRNYPRHSTTNEALSFL